MNYLGTEVTGTTIDQRYGRARHMPDSARSASAERLFHTITSHGPEPWPTQPERKLWASTGLAPWQILRVREYIELRLGEVVHVACLARIAKLSPSHFARAFKASFGIAPATYVAIRRIERAKALMLATDETLSQISLDCGFCDQSHLSHVFSRRVGAAPSRWRREHRAA